MRQYLELTESLAQVNIEIKTASASLDLLVIEKYPTLTTDEIKSLVIEDKWLKSILQKVDGEIQRLSQTLTQRIKELGERYDTPVTTIMNDVSHWESKVNEHLKVMGYEVF